MNSLSTIWKATSHKYLYCDTKSFILVWTYYRPSARVFLFFLKNFLSNHVCDMKVLWVNLIFKICLYKQKHIVEGILIHQKDFIENSSA